MARSSGMDFVDKGVDARRRSRAHSASYRLLVAVEARQRLSLALLHAACSSSHAELVGDDWWCWVAPSLDQGEDCSASVTRPARQCLHPAVSLHAQQITKHDQPFSSRTRSSNEFLYRSIKHSSAALRWLCCKFCKFSSWCLMVFSSCLMYSVRRSRKAACACLFLCLRSSDVAYIWQKRQL